MTVCDPVVLQRGVLVTELVFLWVLACLFGSYIAFTLLCELGAKLLRK